MMQDTLDPLMGRRTRHAHVAGWVDPMTYVVAVSGGVDSVVLLDILAGLERSKRWYSRTIKSGYSRTRLVVAHFDHGIRQDSAADRQFVEALARQYGLSFVFDKAELGPKASEAVARQARYDFLRRVKKASSAQAIVTAHHEDDVFETAVLNLLRGTGRKGLSSLRSTAEIYRPLLNTPKDHIKAYARRRGLEWREDSTNTDTGYLRNHVRHDILSRLDEGSRQQLRSIILSAHQRNTEIDGLLAQQLNLQPASDRLARPWFIMLPHAVAREIIAAWLRNFGINQFDKVLLERITVAAKTYLPSKTVDVNGQYVVTVGIDDIVLAPRRM